MLTSMTGFGRGAGQTEDFAFTVEIASVNRKQFDATIWLPREWQAFESRLMSHLKQRISRGALKFSLSVTPLSSQSMSSGIKHYLAQLTAAAEALGIPGKLTLADLVALPAEAIKVQLPEPTDEIYDTLLPIVNQALDHMIEMRVHEGALIADDLQERLNRLHAIYLSIREIAPTQPALYREALQKRINELLPTGLTLDEETLAREVALFADRCDIAEELTRLDAHFVHAQTLLRGETPAGRPLDFLCQEFFREINTTGSKCNNSEIAHRVIEFKTLLETFREQVQNLE